MTNNEIKKALECCADEYIHSCDYCPFEKECNGDNLNLVKYALDLINRLEAKVDFMTEQRDIYMQDATELSQKVDKLEAENKAIVAGQETLQKALAEKNAEIERLYSTINKIGTGIANIEKILPDLRKEIKAEAIKDVLLQLEAEAESSDKYIREYDDSEIQKAYNKGLWTAYNLVKEMVGDTE